MNVDSFNLNVKDAMAKMKRDYKNQEEKEIRIAKIIFVSIFIFVFGIFSSCAVSCGIDYHITVTGKNKRIAERQALDYAHGINIKTNNVICQNEDNDANGYVSCTITNENKQMLIECPGYRFFGQEFATCRIPVRNQLIIHE